MAESASEESAKGLMEDAKHLVETIAQQEFQKELQKMEFQREAQVAQYGEVLREKRERRAQKREARAQKKEARAQGKSKSRFPFFGKNKNEPTIKKGDFAQSPTSEQSAPQKAEPVRKPQEPQVNYMDHLPPRIQDWMRYYQPRNKEQQSLFDQMKQNLEKGGKLHEQYPALAQLGDTRMLEHLYEYYPGARQHVVQSRDCPKHILEKAVKDPNYEVRRAAFSRSAGLNTAMDMAAKESVAKNMAQTMTRPKAPIDLGRGR